MKKSVGLPQVSKHLKRGARTRTHVVTVVLGQRTDSGCPHQAGPATKQKRMVKSRKGDRGNMAMVGVCMLTGVLGLNRAELGKGSEVCSIKWSWSN